MRVGSKKSGGPTKTGGSRGATRSTKKDQASLKSLGELTSALTSDSASVSDSVEVTDHTTAIQVIKDLVDATPDLRANEVDRIRKMLSRGQYKIDYEKVADAFLREVILSELARKLKKRNL